MLMWQLFINKSKKYKLNCVIELLFIIIIYCFFKKNLLFRWDILRQPLNGFWTINPATETDFCDDIERCRVGML